MVAISTRRSPKQSWTVAHLATEEPEAVAYLHDDWDDATLESTPSIKLDLSPAKNSTTILRRDGEPSEIIISVDRKLSSSRKFMRKLWKAIRLLIFYFWRKSKSSGSSQEEGVDLGQYGVMV